MGAEEVRAKIKKYLEDEHLDSSTNTYDKNDPRLIEASLEIAEESKSIMGGLYFDFRKPEDSFTRKIKNKIIEKIANIVRNTLERPLLTQQKFNEQMYYLVNTLLDENKQLKQELEKLKGDKQD
jgi:hypothetical protein